MSERRTIARAIALFAFAAASLPATPAAAMPVTAGFRDFSYGTTVTAPTGQKPQSKLWWADGRWWAVMFNDFTNRFEIYGFNRATQGTNAWSTTGTVIDVRRTSQADVKWTGSKLFVLSHVKEGAPTLDQSVTVSRYGYTPGTGAYTPETSTTIANKALEAVVFDRDSSGRLWATWTDDNGAGGRAVYVTHTVAGDTDFVSPYVLPVADAATLSADDISTIVASGGKIAVLWSNQANAKLSLATHDDASGDDGAWTATTLCSTTSCPDDHLNIKSVDGDPTGRVLAIVKTSLNDVASPGSAPLVVLYRIDVRTLTFAGHTVWTVADDVTRPIVQIDRQNSDVYAFAAGPCCAGGVVYMKKSGLANPAFAPGRGAPFIQSAADTEIDNPTSTKQSLDATTGLLVLAADDQTRSYLHNYLPLGAGAAYPEPGRGAAAELSIAARPTTTVFGRPTVISGRLRGGSADGTTVALRADEYPFAGDSAVASVRTEADGSYSFTRNPTRNTLFRTTAGPSRSQAARVSVRPRVSLRVSDRTPRVGRQVRFSGRVCPAHDGMGVSIQRRVRSRRYLAVRRSRLLGAPRCSRYRRVLRVRRDGRYRVTFKDADHARGSSRSRLIDVHR